MNQADKFIISAANHDLKYFTMSMVPGYMLAAHNRLICEKLMDLEAGRIKRLMINCPPRAGKSLLSSQLFPAWFLGRNPDRNVICSTYGQDLADLFGRAVRNTLQDERYQAIFPSSRISADSASVKKFATTEGGMYTAVGVNGPLTGVGGDLILIDDPTKNRADANSKLLRTKITDWFKSTLYTRLSPEGRICLIQTRWHQEDLTGYLLANEPDKWEVINIPAINDEGESYWPERWSVDKLNNIRETIGTYEFTSLYQQKPVPKENTMFQRSWFETVAAVPQNAKRVRYWDRAATAKKDGNDPDWTVGLKMAKDDDGVLYIEDIRRFRASSLEVQKAINNTASQDGFKTTIGLEQDPGQAGKSEVEYLIRQLQGFIARPYKVIKDKITRAQAVTAQAEAGNIKILRGTWNEDFLDELEMFPFGSHDDQIDTLSGAFNMLVTSGLDYSLFTKM